MKRFALIGAAGYVAPRHIKAIRDTGNRLVAALDPHDSAGILDSYFPEASFFTEFERFDRHIDKLRRDPKLQPVQYVTVCSPNYLHDAHIRFALRSNADAICEKPLVLNPWNIDPLQWMEKETGRKVYTVLQLRLHPAVIAIKNEMDAAAPGSKFDVTLTYVTSRGNWYFNSWKGDEKKSGGIITNIGVHFFDMLYFLFGVPVESKLHYRDEYRAGGFLEYEKARVKWFVSVDGQDIPDNKKLQQERTYRSLLINKNEIDLSEAFTDLHTTVYREILAGKGFGLEENRATIETVATLRTRQPSGLKGDYHPFLKRTGI